MTATHWLLSPWLYLPAAALAAAAAWLFFAALFRDRSHARHPRPRCPKCWYDLSGARPQLPITCPECGQMIRVELDLHRTRRRPALAAFAILLFAPLAALLILRGDARRAWYAVPPRWTTVEVLRSGETVAKLRRLRDPNARGAMATVMHRGRVVLTLEDHHIEFGEPFLRPYEIRHDRRHGAVGDVNADGVDDLVVFSYSGGAHCCYTVHIVELTDPLRIAAVIDAGNGMGLEPIGAGDPLAGGAVFNIPDQSFCYWNAPYVDSPQPSVKYVLTDHALRIAPERMRWPEDLARARAFDRVIEIRALLAVPGAQLEPDMWRDMLDLIYAGHEQLAWERFDACWPPTRPGKDALKQEFLAVLHKSPQYRDFKAALAAQAEGKPIPPALVGQHVPQSPADPPPSP